MTPNPEMTDAGLLRRIRQGDEESFVALFRRWQGPLFRFALHMSGHRPLAEDVTQEVFMVILRNPGQYDPARGEFRAYAMGIARNMTLKALEANRRFSPWPDDDGEFGLTSPRVCAPAVSISSAEEELHRSESLSRLRQAILALPVAYREVVVFCEIQEMSYEEAAGIIECPVGTIRSRLSRARHILAERLRADSADWAGSLAR